LRTARDSWNAIIATNLTALFDGAQLALPDLQSPGKRLIIVASVAGLKGGAMAAPYVASKHGAVGLTRSLALEFARTGLTVNAICPSFVDTPMADDSAERIGRATGKSVEQARQLLARTNSNGRLITVDEVTHAIMQLCHPDAGGVNGACVTIDGGTSA
jgi:NAD(P)-dependent dehydrogenase (short-subunit alcohol dehydrogenase family)